MIRRPVAALLLALAACGESSGPNPPPVDASGFQIDIFYVGTPPTGAIAQAFSDAAARIESHITGDLQAIRVGTNAAPFEVKSCVAPSTSFDDAEPVNDVFDDLVIFVKVEAIDGVGQVLGAAGPCLTRTTTGHTALGLMRFDSADLQTLANNGRLGAVILHEMLHVVGVGTLWQSKGLLVDTSTTNVRVTGPLAVAACVNDHGGAAACAGSAVPAEDCEDLSPSLNCGAGTRNSHWKESVFQTELMTGYAGAVNPLSRMTIQSLADLGYTVSLQGADAYSVPAPVTAFRDLIADDPTPALALPDPMTPRYSIDPSGLLKRLRR